MISRRRQFQLAGAVILVAILAAWTASQPYTPVGRSYPEWNALFGPAPNGFWEYLYTGKLPKVKPVPTGGA